MVTVELGQTCVFGYIKWNTCILAINQERVEFEQKREYYFPHILLLRKMHIVSNQYMFVSPFSMKQILVTRN